MDLRVDPGTGELHGTARISATRIGEGPLVLHERGLKELVVSLPFVQGEEQIEVDVEGDEVELEASWTALAGPFFGLVLTDGKMYTTNEPEAARMWLLCADDPADKATLDWTIHTPADLTVAAIGDFVEVVDGGDTRAWHWRMDIPTPTYLYAFHVADYVLTVSDDPIPVWTWAYPGLDVGVLDNTYEMLAFFSERYGPYPFSRYGNAVAPMESAMENPGAVTFGEHLLQDAEYAELINVHELGHHWWGDDVTLGTWDDIWLNEGFASYTEALWYEQLYGDEGRIAYAEYFVDSWLASGEDGPVYAPGYMFGSTVYDKGGMVVHMLRGVMGDEAFFAGLQAYELRFRQGNAVTSDLEAVMAEVYGAPLDWFFDEWVYDDGTPAFVLGTAFTAYEGGTQVDVRIEQSGVSDFQMPVPVRIFSDEGPRDEVIWVDGKRGEASFCVPGDATLVELDPEQWVLWADSSTTTIAAGEPVCVEESCGCSAAPRAWGWLGLIALVGVRRRR